MFLRNKTQIFFDVFPCVPDSFELVYWAYSTDAEVGVKLVNGEILLQEKTPLVVGET